MSMRFCASGNGFCSTAPPPFLSIMILARSESAITLRSADIVDLAGCLGRQRRRDEGFHGVVDKEKIAILGASPDLDRLPLQQSAHPNAHENLPCVANAHVRPVGVGKAKNGGRDAVHVAVEDMIAFPGNLIDTVDIDWANRVRLINW